MSMNAGAHTHSPQALTMQAAMMSCDNGTGSGRGSAVSNQPTSAFSSSTRRGPPPHVKRLNLHKRSSFNDAVAASSPSALQSPASATSPSFGAMPRSARSQLLAGLRTTPRSTSTANVAPSLASPPPSADYEHDYYNQLQYQHLSCNDNNNVDPIQSLHAAQIQAHIRAAQTQDQVQLLGIQGQLSPDSNAPYEFVSQMSPRMYSLPEHVLAPPAVEIPAGTDSEPANRQLRAELNYLAAQQQRLQQQLLAVTAAAQQIQNINAMAIGSNHGDFGDHVHLAQQQQQYRQQQRYTQPDTQNNTTPITDDSVYSLGYNLTIGHAIQDDNAMEQESDLSWEEDMHDAIAQLEEPATFYDDFLPLCDIRDYHSGSHHAENLQKQHTFPAPTFSYVPSRPMSPSGHSTATQTVTSATAAVLDSTAFRNPDASASPTKRLEKRPLMVDPDHDDINVTNEQLGHSRMPSWTNISSLPATPITTMTRDFAGNSSRSQYPATTTRRHNTHEFQPVQQLYGPPAIDMPKSMPQNEDSRNFAMQQRRLAVRNLQHARMERRNGGIGDNSAAYSLTSYGSENLGSHNQSQDFNLEHTNVSHSRRNSRRSGSGSGASLSGSITPGSENGLPFSSSESSFTSAEVGESGTRFTSANGSSCATPLLSNKPSLGSIRAAVSGTIGSERKEKQKVLAPSINNHVGRMTNPFASSSTSFATSSSISTLPTITTAPTSTSMLSSSTSPTTTTMTTITDDNEVMTKFAGLGISDNNDHAAVALSPTTSAMSPFDPINR